MSTLEELISMGFDENISKLALEQCNTGNIEDVINWILCYAAESENEVTNDSTCQESMKLVLVVRADLQMTPGKVAAQCVHAALAVAAKVETLDPTSLFYWKNEGEATICLRCGSEDELNGLETRAIASGNFTDIHLQVI